jgi:hypothetical protein
MHIRPWEHALLTVDDMDQAIADCEAYVRESKRASEG